MEFHNREKEIEGLMRIIKSEPTLITFIYGPINSGKTALIKKVIEDLPKDYVAFYINLRERMIKDYRDFIQELFETFDVKENLLLDLLEETTKFMGIPISRNLLEKIFSRDKPGDAFKYIVNLTRKLKDSGRTPIIVLDELQKIKDIKINGYLLYELFNLFISLTKENHSAHVFAITSDSLFIERVFRETKLYGRARYFLVDDFDYKTTEEFLRKHGFSSEEIELTWKYFGGKPVFLIEAINNKDNIKEFCASQLSLRKRQIKEIIKGRNFKILKEFKGKEEVIVEEIDEEIEYLVENNILFFDPVRGILKPQSRLDLLAIREIVP